MRLALIEPYYGGSHQAWADGYASSSGHNVTLITHPARFWKWRMHGSFLTLADALVDEVATHGPPDVILASSMMDVAAFAGAVRHVVPGVPIAVYFHESQFTYPLSPADRPDATYQMKNWSSAATADLVIFNSEFHRSLFRDEAKRFLNSFPEYKHVDKVDDVIGRAVILPVGIDLTGLDRSARRDRPPLILWNQRWEHDKGPDELKLIVSGLLSSGRDFRMAMCGEVFLSVPLSMRRSQTCLVTVLCTQDGQSATGTSSCSAKRRWCCPQPVRSSSVSALPRPSLPARIRCSPTVSSTPNGSPTSQPTLWSPYTAHPSRQWNSSSTPSTTNPTPQCPKPQESSPGTQSHPSTTEDSND